MAKPDIPTGNAKAKGNSALAVLTAALVVAACASGAGFLAGTQAGKLALADEAKKPKQAAARTSFDDVQVLQLPTIVTNLAGTESSWVRLEAVVLVGGKEAVQSDLAARLAQDMTALLRTLSIRQISGASGLNHLREELLDRLKVRSSDRVRDIMINTLVIE